MKKSTCNVLIKTCKVKRDDKIQYNGLKNCLKVFETKKKHFDSALQRKQTSSIKTVTDCDGDAVLESVERI